MTEHTPRIERVATGHPRFRIDQVDAAVGVDRAARNQGRHLSLIERMAGEQRRAVAIARATSIKSRAMVATAEEIGALGSIEERNDIYVREAPRLAEEVVRKVASPAATSEVACLVTSSCTGFDIPGWGAEVLERLAFPGDAHRVSLTEAGCAGGVLALARAADHVRLHAGSAIAVALELCSLSFQAGGDEGNMTASLIFGDGCGAAYLTSGGGPGLDVIDSSSFLVPDSRGALGFRLTDTGFYPIIERRLGELLLAPTEAAVSALLGRHGLVPSDVSEWLIHPGGGAILTNLQQRLGVTKESMRWSWQAMQANGNMSSAAIFDVLERYLSEPEAPRGWGIVAAFGPGVSIELLLVRSSP